MGRRGRGERQKSDCSCCSGMRSDGEERTFDRRDEFMYDDRGIVEHRVTFTARPPAVDQSPPPSFGKSSYVQGGSKK